MVRNGSKARIADEYLVHRPERRNRPRKLREGRYQMLPNNLAGRVALEPLGTRVPTDHKTLRARHSEPNRLRWIGADGSAWIRDVTREERGKIHIDHQ